MPAVPQILKTIFLEIDGEDFSQDVIDAEVVPTPGDVQTALTLDGVAHSDIATETWGLRLNCIVDWDTVRPGFASWAYDNRGQTKAFEFGDTTAAQSTTKPRMTGTVRIVPITYGGNGNEFAEFEVVLPITGTPVPDTAP